MRIGYANSAHSDPLAAAQLDALRRSGCSEIVVEESERGVHRQLSLEALLMRLNVGDTLVVASLDRLARSLSGLLSVLRALDTKRAELHSLGDSIHSADSSSNSIFQFAKALAQAERTMLIERTQTGRTVAKRKGTKLGRRNKLSTDQVTHARRLLDLGEGGRAVARTFGVSEATLYRALRQHPRGT